MSLVALAGCPSYESGLVYDAIKKGITLLGGVSEFVRPGEKILLKPNMLAGRSPELAVTTHPAVFEAAAKIFQAAGAILCYGDSPGYGSPKQAARKAGLAQTAERLGIEEADFENPADAAFSAGVELPGGGGQGLHLVRGVCEADGIISLPKMKTHSLTRITGAVKNQLGCIPGFEKARLHFRYPNALRFSAVLAAITKAVNPRLYIMDGITAMEGEGPAGGNPVAMGLILLSRDPVALDAVFCRLIGLSPAFVPTIQAGETLGMGTAEKDAITLTGDPINKFINLNFDVVRQPVSADFTFRILRPLRNKLIPRPVIRPEACRKCGVCVEACPVHPLTALEFPPGERNSPPVYRYSRCIRCYCCQEMCPHKAIRVKTPLLGRLVMRFLGKI
jgi:uncharacterized protein (DUF362 family)/NAD-dependent dihydropyrimidine dehydrogenase PreA subunit